MIKVLFAFALALMPEAVFSQAMDTVPPKRITKVIRVHYGNPERLANIVSHNAPVTADWDDALKAVILKGTHTDIVTAEGTIQELDQPPTVSTTGDIELVVHVLGGSDEPGASAFEGDLSSLEPVVKQLRTIFPYKHYELLSTMLMRSQQGTSADSSGLIRYPPGVKSASSYPDDYQIAYGAASVSMDKGKPTIHLGNFRFRSKIGVNTSTIPHTTQYQVFDVGMSSAVDLQPGQQAVVGNTNVGSGNAALFIVLSAKLVD